MILIKFFLIASTFQFVLSSLSISGCTISFDSTTFNGEISSSNFWVDFTSRFNFDIENEDIPVITRKSLTCRSNFIEISAELIIKLQQSHLNATAESFNKAAKEYFNDLCLQQSSEIKTKSLMSRLLNDEAVGVKMELECRDEMMKCIRSAKGVFNGFKNAELLTFYIDSVNKIEQDQDAPSNLDDDEFSIFTGIQNYATINEIITRYTNSRVYVQPSSDVPSHIHYDTDFLELSSGALHNHRTINELRVNDGTVHNHGTIKKLIINKGFVHNHDRIDELHFYDGMVIKSWNGTSQIGLLYDQLFNYGTIDKLFIYKVLNN